MTAYNKHLPRGYIDEVVSGKQPCDLNLVVFPNPDQFVAGQLHQHYDQWLTISSDSNEEANEILTLIKDGVDVFQYFRHFRGSFKGENYNSDLPPKRIFANNACCKSFSSFISRTILERIASGAISVWGKVGDVPPPHLVMPLTIEPSKPRLCNDNRFLNLWTVDRPFHLDRLPCLPRYVFSNSFQSVTDDKSGYDHLLLTSESRTFFGSTSNTIPFGWKLSAYVYHSTGSLASHHCRTIGIPCSLYIDD